MRICPILRVVCLCAMAVAISGCTSGSKKAKVGKATAKPTRVIFTAQSNPTTDAGRGEPSIDDQFRPAAWVLVDGTSGTFVQRDGRDQLEWMIEGTVSSTPTFRVEVIESIAGKPKDFSCLLRARSDSGEADVYYAIASEEGSFELGKEYSLLKPGSGFVIRNGFTRDVVAEIPPLAPGNYLITGAIGKAGTGKRVLAVSHFTVGE